MTKTSISDEDIEKALDYLKEGADQAAAARANRIYLEEYRKSLKAQLMQRNAMGALGAQERDAYASKEYQTHLKTLQQAIYEDERHRFLLESAKATIDAWRTARATERAMNL